MGITFNTQKTSWKTYIFDLDGVVYRGWELQHSARETILTLKERGHIVRYFTNNSASSRDSYSTKLGKLGIPTPPEHVMTTSYAAALYLMDKGAAGKTVYYVGGEGIREELEAVGIRVLADDQEPDAHIDYVVVGLDQKFSYAKLTRAMRVISGGAEFVATNLDASFPLEENKLLPGAGTIVAAIQTATAVTPYLVGKPETFALRKILEMTNSTACEAVMIGDRLDTDVMLGKRGGLHTVLVLTGISSRDEALALPSEYQPDRIIETLGELLT